MADPRLKQAIEAKDFILAPGVFDLISALVADRAGFKALYVTGYGTVASYLGLPDAGIATYRDMVERIGQIVKMTNTPVIADADTGCDRHSDRRPGIPEEMRPHAQPPGHSA